jgi:hypothetical protein
MRRTAWRGAAALFQFYFDSLSNRAALALTRALIHHAQSNARLRKYFVML